MAPTNPARSKEPADDIPASMGGEAEDAPEPGTPAEVTQPEDVLLAHEDEVRGHHSIGDVGGHFDASGFAGVSGDRLVKPSDVTRYPFWSQEEIDAENERAAEIEATRAATKKETAERQKARDTEARENLHRLLKG